MMAVISMRVIIVILRRSSWIEKLKENKEGKGKEAPERIANALQQRVFALSQEAVNKPPEPESKK